MVVHSGHRKGGRNRKIADRVKRQATHQHQHRSRWLRLAVTHETQLSGSGDAYASCVCGEFAPRKPTARRYAQGAGTRHLNTVRNSVEVAA